MYINNFYFDQLFAGMKEEQLYFFFFPSKLLSHEPADLESALFITLFFLFFDNFFIFYFF